MRPKSEIVNSNPELTTAAAEFVSELQVLAPELEDGQIARFVESTLIQRPSGEFYGCTVTPTGDRQSPPTLDLFFGRSGICNSRELFSFDEDSGHYIRRVVTTEPSWETMPPDGYWQEPTPATALELSAVVGIVKTLIKEILSPINEAET